MKTAVVIMSKIPVPGFTKTRLNAVLSEQESAAFHRACLADISRAVVNSHLPGYIYYLPAHRHSLAAIEEQPSEELWRFFANVRYHFNLRPQEGTDLGERLYNAAKDLLSNYEAVIFLGSDTPGITSELILEAQAKMLSNDVVIGPAPDGGYYLLAIKQACPDMFMEIPWSTPQVYLQTMAVIKQQKLVCSLLPVHDDIDTWDDLLHFYRDGKSDKYDYYRKLEAYQQAYALINKYGVLEEDSSVG